ncbi:Flp family type IVb pilin [Pseudomonas sp. GNP014]
MDTPKVVLHGLTAPYYFGVNPFLQLLGRKMPTMLMLAQGNHVANAQHLVCSRRTLMSYSRVARKIKGQMAFFKRLAKDTEGASAIEYALVVGLVALVIAAFGNGIGLRVTAILTSIQTALGG